MKKNIPLLILFAIGFAYCNDIKQKQETESSGSASTAVKPNILLIVSDDLGFNAISPLCGPTLTPTL